MNRQKRDKRAGGDRQIQRYIYIYTQRDRERDKRGRIRVDIADHKKKQLL